MKKLVSTLLIVGFVLGAFQISSSVEAEQIEGNITSSPTPVFLDVKDNHWFRHHLD